MNKILIVILVIALIAGGVALGFMGSEWLSRGELEDVRAELNGQISALEAEIAEKNERIRTLESERNALSTEKGELEANLKALDEEKTELEAEKAELEDSLATLEEEKKALDDKAVELDASIKSLNDKVASLEASGDADEAEIAKLKGDIASLESEKSAVANKVTALEGDISDKSAEIEGLNSAIDGLEAEKAELNSQVSSLEAEIAEKDTEINGLSSSVSTLQGEKWALEDQILNLEEKNQALENEKNELEKENETLKNCLSGDHDLAGYEYRFSADMTTADKNAMCLNCKKAYETETVATVYEKPKLTATFAGDDVKMWDITDGVSLTAEELRAGVTYMLSKGDRELDITLPAEADIDKLIAIRRALIDTEDVDSGSVSLTLRGITEIPDYHFYDGFEYHGDGVFGGWNVDGMSENVDALGSVTLTDVRYIGESAFSKCYYLSCFSAPLATEVGSDAFNGSLDNAEVYLPLVETVGDAAFEFSELTEISLPSAKSIGNFSFNSCSDLSKIHLPSVNNIGMYAFQSCIALTQLTLGNLESVNHHGFGIFNGASDTADIDLTVSCAQKALTLGGDNYWTPTDTLYTDTDDYANGVFMGYTFKSVSIFHEIEYTVGDGVHTADCSLCDYTESETHTFDSDLGKCTVCDEPIAIDATQMNAEQLNNAVAIRLAAGLTDIEVTLAPDAPAEMITAIRRAICDTEGVADGSINLTLKGVTSIPGTTNWDGVAFGPGDIYDEAGEIVDQELVTQLASINLPDVTEIGAQAFYFCENLVSVSAPKAQTIGAQALGYTALTSVEFPELTSIPTDMFSGTWTLSSAKFPKVTTIEQGGLLVGAKFAPENNPTPFPLELTAEGDITFNGSNHFNIASQNYSGKVDLVLNIDKKDQVTFHDDGTATWQIRDDLSYTFKSITFVGE